MHDGIEVPRRGVLEHLQQVRLGSHGRTENLDLAKEHVAQINGGLEATGCAAGDDIEHSLALQTREQHIRRERATSNICTNHSLCALASAIYMSSLGGSGIKTLARLNYDKSEYLKRALRQAGFAIPFAQPTFNEFVVQFKDGFDKTYERLTAEKIIAGLPLECYYPELPNHYLLCVTETISKQDMDELVQKINWKKYGIRSNSKMDSGSIRITEENKGKIYPEKSPADIMAQEMILKWGDYKYRRCGLKPLIDESQNIESLKDIFSVFQKNLGWDSSVFRKSD